MEEQVFPHQVFQILQVKNRLTSPNLQWKLIAKTINRSGLSCIHAYRFNMKTHFLVKA